MGDEGVGVHIIHQLEKEELPPQTELLDGGTGGFHLLSYLEEYPQVIMIDATMDGEEAGKIKLIRPKFAADFPTALSAHDIGLKDLIESVILLDKLPDIFLFTVSITKIQAMQTELSPEVKKTIPEVISEVKKLVKQLIA